MPGIRLKKKSSQNVLAHSRNHLSKTRKYSKKRNNKKRKASRKSKVLYGGAEHTDVMSIGIELRAKERSKILQKKTPQLTQPQQPISFTSNTLTTPTNILNIIKNVLMRK